MKKFLALFYKEFRETSAFTFFLFSFTLVVFLLDDRFHLFENNFSQIIVPIAILLNLTLLSATAFSREVENMTFETLKRIATDWRATAACKFGYAIFSTLILFLMFLLFSPLYASLSGIELFSLEGELSQQLSMTIFFGFDAFCWAIFWSGRTNKSFNSIAFAIACPSIIVAFISLVLDPEGIAQRFGTAIGLACMFGPRAIIDLLVLFLAPGKTRFGYVEYKNATKRSDSHDSKDRQFDLTTNKSNVFLSLFRHELGALSLFGRRWTTTILEVVLLGALVFIFPYLKTTFNVDGGRLYGRYYLWIVFAALASGALADSKNDRSSLKERFDVSTLKYFLASFFAVLVVGLGLFAIGSCIYVKHYVPLFYSQALNERSLTTFFEALLKYASHATESLAPQNTIIPERAGSPFPLIAFASGVQLFAIALWSASLRGTRVVAFARTLFFLAISIGTFLGVYQASSVSSRGLYEWIPVNVQLFILAFLTFSFVFLALCPIIAAYRIVRCHMAYRSSWFGATLPIVVPIALLVFLGAATSYASRQNVPERLPALNNAETSSSVSVDKNSNASVSLFVVGGKSCERAATYLLENYAGDHKKKLFQEQKIDKETDFYRCLEQALESNLNKGESSFEYCEFNAEKTLEFLQRIPELRTTPFDEAISAYAKMKTIDPRVLTAKDPRVHTAEVNHNFCQYIQMEKKDLARKIELAAWNFAQTYPSYMKEAFDLIDGKIDSAPIPETFVSNDVTYNTVQRDLYKNLVSKTIINELTRRVYVVYFASQVYREQKGKIPNCINDLVDSGLLSEEYDPNLNQHFVFRITEPSSDEILQDKDIAYRKNLDYSCILDGIFACAAKENRFEINVFSLKNSRLFYVNTPYSFKGINSSRIDRTNPILGARFIKQKDRIFTESPSLIVGLSPKVLELISQDAILRQRTYAYAGSVYSKSLVDETYRPTIAKLLVLTLESNAKQSFE